jgi:hypothetical protein
LILNITASHTVGRGEFGKLEKEAKIQKKLVCFKLGFQAQKSLYSKYTTSRIFNFQPYVKQKIELYLNTIKLQNFYYTKNSLGCEISLNY